MGREETSEVALGSPVNRAFGDIEQRGYEHRAEATPWTIDEDAKVHEVSEEKKQRAVKSYNGIKNTVRTTVVRPRVKAFQPKAAGFRL